MSYESKPHSNGYDPHVESAASGTSYEQTGGPETSNSGYENQLGSENQLNTAYGGMTGDADGTGGYDSFDPNKSDDDEREGTFQKDSIDLHVQEDYEPRDSTSPDESEGGLKPTVTQDSQHLDRLLWIEEDDD